VISLTEVNVGVAQASSSLQDPSRPRSSERTTFIIDLPANLSGQAGSGRWVIPPSAAIDERGGRRVLCVHGTMDVRYGANGSFSFQTLTDGTACTNEVFGDPARTRRNNAPSG
jgi:hypothetical protein